MKNKYITSFVIFTILILVIYIFFLKDNIYNNSNLPKYALKNERIKESYLFSKENPSALDGVNCYCGCMKVPHYGRIHKRGLLDCFTKENGDFDIHGSECNTCVDDALYVKDLINEDKTKEEIKDIIDIKYAST